MSRGSKIIFLLKIRKKFPSFIRKFLDLLIRIIFSCDIPSTVKFGENLKLPHLALGVVIHPRCEIGSDCKIYQNVTIGSRNGSHPPTIGNNVLIGAGAVILGEITIGNNVKIGANAIVVKDVPDNAVVMGPAAQVIGGLQDDHICT